LKGFKLGVKERGSYVNTDDERDVTEKLEMMEAEGQRE